MNSASLKETLGEDTILELEMGAALTLSPESSVRDAIKALQEHRMGALMIERDGRVVGVFTERDLVKKVLRLKRPLDTPLNHVMTESPSMLRKDARLIDALKLFHRGGFRHVPVTDEHEKAIGMLSIKALVNYLVELYPDAVYNLPPDPGRVSTNLSGG